MSTRTEQPDGRRRADGRVAADGREADELENVGHRRGGLRRAGGWDARVGSVVAAARPVRTARRATGARGSGASVGARPVHVAGDRRSADDERAGLASAGGRRGIRGAGAVTARAARRLLGRRADEPEQDRVGAARNGSGVGSDERARARMREAAAGEAAADDQTGDVSSLRARAAGAEGARIQPALPDLLHGDRRARTEGSDVRDRLAGRPHRHAPRRARSAGAARVCVSAPSGEGARDTRSRGARRSHRRRARGDARVIARGRSRATRSITRTTTGSAS